MDEQTAPPVPEISLLELFALFLRIGLTSFGGSTSAWMYREIVGRRKLMDDNGFMTGLTIAQVLPGANPVNMALYLGMQMRGKLGATLAAIGMVLPAFCVILVLGFLYRRFSDIGMLQFILTGMAASGVGATLQMGTKVAIRLRSAISIVLALAAFVAVGLLRLSMLPVVLVLVPLSIGIQLILARQRNVR